MERNIFVLEIIGTVAFSISGAVAAIENDMDLMGIVTLGATTAVGGGVIRDIILGFTPPNAFREPVYISTALITIAILLIIIKLRERYRRFPRVFTHHLPTVINISDAIGLGTFTVTGVNVAIYSGHGSNLLLAVFVGVLTGVGGGVMRDIFTQQKPYIFMKHIYAFASVIGAVLYLLLRRVMNLHAAMTIGAVSVMLTRYVAAKYQLSLPRFPFPTQMFGGENPDDKAE
ncbi:MAG: trimeric intracellular cation channel family protein [Saccharofermentanales bacterium]|jgi:uncharacterized membrane protein YeiH